MEPNSAVKLPAGDSDLTEFQRKKLLRVFTTFFDINNDGVIEWEDFRIAIEKVRELRQWEDGSENHKNAEETLKLIWDGLKAYADQNKDEKVTMDEWCKMWVECFRSLDVEGAELPEWQQRYRDFMFEVNDTSGDSYIDKDEYTTVYTSYGLSKDTCEKAFDTFSPNGKVDRAEFNRLWREYFVSKDPEAKGNYLFGIPEK